MAQRTRLFQNAGSPLIQGYSRSRQPFWQEWLLSVAFTVGALAVWRVIVAVSGPAAWTDTMWSSVRAAAILGLQVGAVVGGTAVWIGRAMGFKRPWRGGAAVSVLVALFVWVVWPSVG